MLSANNKIDLIYLVHNRKEMTCASLLALEANTNWSRVASLRFYLDGNEDGVHAIAETFGSLRVVAGLAKFERGVHGSPVQAMQNYLWTPGTPVFAKLDNDAMVPPGWLDRCLAVMDRAPELDLLGIEPPLSRTTPPWARGRRERVPEEHPELWRAQNGVGYAQCPYIGGIGLMRRRAFTGHAAMKPHSIYGGFTDWQVREPAVVKGWILPTMPVFLLDRLPIEPWRSLSQKYIAKGWQRPWSVYRPEDSWLWNWWFGARKT